MDLDLTCAQILSGAGINWDVEWSLASESFYPIINGYTVPVADAFDNWDSDTGTCRYEDLTPPSLRCINGEYDFFMMFYRWGPIIPHEDPSYFSEYGPDTSVFLRLNADGTFEAGTKYLVLKGDPSLTFREFVDLVQDISEKAATPSDDYDDAFSGLDYSVSEEGYYEELVAAGGTFQDFCQAVMQRLCELPYIEDVQELGPNAVIKGIIELIEGNYPSIKAKIDPSVAISGIDPKYIDKGPTDPVYSYNQLDNPNIAADSVRQVARILNSTPTYDELVECYYGPREDGNPKSPLWYTEDTLKILFGG